MTTYADNPIRAIREAAGLTSEELEHAVSKMLDERHGVLYDASRTRFVDHLEKWPKVVTHQNVQDCVDAAGLRMTVRLQKRDAT